MGRGFILPKSLDEEISRAKLEIAQAEAEILSGNPRIEECCLWYSDWNTELKLLEEEKMSKYIIQEFKSTIRKFPSGADRDSDENKPHYPGYFDSRVVKAFGEYMLRHQRRVDGSFRAADNWKAGMSKEVYFDSGFRHFMDWWRLYEADHYEGKVCIEPTLEACCALMFNLMGYMRNLIQEKESHELAQAASKAE